MPTGYYSRRPRPALTRFWEKVDRNGPIPPHRPALGSCWVWTAGCTSAGYGMFHPRHGHGTYAHRYSFALVRDLPAGMYVCHRCDNPPCVNPEHLFLGTPADNIHDTISKGRSNPGSALQRASVPRGELHPDAKLTDAAVLDIRARLTSGERTGVLAREYAVSHSAISMIGSGKIWRHLLPTKQTE